MKYPGKSGWLWLSALVIALDQLSKWFVAARMQPFETLYLLPVFNIALLHNTGAAFSMLAGASGWQRWLFVALALGISGLIVAWLARMPAAGGRTVAVGLALVAGGAVGNVTDRLMHGYVVDFLQFHWQGWFFPAFNLADSAITLGAALLILDGVLLERRVR
jgi:signal peptidase II